MNYLTQQDVLDLHAFVIMRYGGLMGVKSHDRLKTALNAPRQQMFGAELYPDVCSKAAALGYIIIKSHPFLSGNELTALLAMLRLLEINGLRLRADIGHGELIRLIRALNHSDMSREGLDGWLRDNVTEHD